MSKIFSVVDFLTLGSSAQLTGHRSRRSLRRRSMQSGLLRYRWSLSFSAPINARAPFLPQSLFPLFCKFRVFLPPSCHTHVYLIHPNPSSTDSLLRLCAAWTVQILFILRSSSCRQLTRPPRSLISLFGEFHFFPLPRGSVTHYSRLPDCSPRSQTLAVFRVWG